MPTRVEVRGHHHSTRCVLVNSVHSIVSNRLNDGEEQYLVRWESEEPLNNSSTPPLSWHSIKELRHCLEQVQDYLNTRTILSNASLKASSESKKRKCPESTDEIERRPSPLERRLQVDRHRSTSTPASRSSSVAPSLPLPSSYDVYNGILEVDKHNCIYVRSASGPHILVMNLEVVSSRSMIISAQKSKVDTALIEIRNTYVRRLAKVQVKPIHLINLVDATTPSLRFRFVSECILDEQQGVYRASSETQQGCTQCSPNMGRSIGCEYTKKCDCLEYAAVDEARINDQETMEAYQVAMASGQSTLGFPKKFPYFAEGTKPERVGCLVPFYLNSRRPIYECNDKCGCGDHCRNKNVQFGRQVEVEIFRTQGGRGWGLKCRQDLQEGQFIDTYRGEIITDAEATRREEASTKAKASYLYSLDKFAESENIPEEDIFVVDGEFMGGPTIFLNHSCDPNCRQYTVSYNRHDPRVYDIAFFACRFIPAGEELTFDYLDKDEADEPTDEPGEDAVPCLCGAKNCRKWLWT